MKATAHARRRLSTDRNMALRIMEHLATYPAQSQREVARLYDVSPNIISRIIAGRGAYQYLRNSPEWRDMTDKRLSFLSKVEAGKPKAPKPRASRSFSREDVYKYVAQMREHPDLPPQALAQMLGIASVSVLRIRRASDQYRWLRETKEWQEMRRLQEAAGSVPPMKPMPAPTEEAAAATAAPPPMPEAVRYDTDGVVVRPKDGYDMPVWPGPQSTTEYARQRQALPEVPPGTVPASNGRDMRYASVYPHISPPASQANYVMPLVRSQRESESEAGESESAAANVTASAAPEAPPIDPKLLASVSLLVETVGLSALHLRSLEADEQERKEIRKLVADTYESLALLTDSLKALSERLL